MNKCALIGALAAAMCACGDDDNLADPMLIEGGGIRSGEIAGRVNLYVIDSATEDPISGADVWIGEPGEDPITGVTDSSGFLQIDDGALKGPTTITVVASGFAAATWFGANGANITVPLDADDPGTPTIPQAQLSGDITGWDSLPAPAQDHILVGVVTYSQSRDLGDDANNLPQPGGTGGLPANACVRSEAINQCDWTLNVRAGSIALMSIFVDIDTKGTQDDGDDESTVVGYAYKTGIAVEDGVDQSGISLTQVDVANLTTVEITTATPPAGLDDIASILGLDLGDDGIVQLGFLEQVTGDLSVPDLAGPFADASYQAVAFAQMGEGDDAPSTAIIKRGITDLSSAIAMGEWLPLPSNMTESGGEYSFTPVDGSALHVVDFSDTIGTVWNVALIDGRTTFTLPGLDPSPLPSSYDMSVSAFDGAINLSDFSIDEFVDGFDRISDNTSSIGN